MLKEDGLTWLAIVLLAGSLEIPQRMIDQLEDVSKQIGKYSFLMLMTPQGEHWMVLSTWAVILVSEEYLRKWKEDVRSWDGGPFWGDPTIDKEIVGKHTVLLSIYIRMWNMDTS